MFLRKNNIFILLLLLIFTSCGNNRVDNLPRTAKSNIIQKLEDEADIIKNNVHILSWAYYLDKGQERWYISPTNAYQKVGVYSLMPIKNGNAGWATVGQNVAQFDLEDETITIDYITDNYDYLYYDIGWKSWNTDSLIQSDIMKIRNSTVDIKWWFFQAPNGYWYIINKSGEILRFSSKLNFNGYEEYNWIDIDIGNFKPIFFIENGIKKVKFYNNNLNQMPIANAGSDKTVTVNETVTINGSGTDSDGYIVSYEWKKGDVVLGTSATLIYTPTEVGIDTLTLTVMDDDGATASDNIIITVQENITTSSNLFKGDIIGWKESGSVFNFDEHVNVISNIQGWWSINTINPPRGWFYGENSSTKVAHLTEINNICEINDASIYSYKDYSIGPVNKGDIILFHNIDTGYYGAFIVKDIYGSSSSAFADITWFLQGNKSSNFGPCHNVNQENQAPIVNAGVDQTTIINQSITLTGNASDSDGYIVSYEWKKGDIVLGTSATLIYTPTEVGTDTLTLTVMDDDGATSSDSIKIFVQKESNNNSDFGGKK